MKRPKTSSKKISWFSIASVFLLAVALAVGVSTNVQAASGSFDRETYFPDLGSSDQDRLWLSVNDSTGNTSDGRDTIEVTIKNATKVVSASFTLQETGGTTTVFTSTGSAQPVAYPVGSTSGYVEGFNSGSHNYPALGASVVGLNLKELSSNGAGDATLGSPAGDGELSVASGDTLQLLYSGATLDTAIVKTNSGSFSFSPSSVSAVTTNSLSAHNLIISLTDQDENLNPVAKDVIGFADNSALLTGVGVPGTGSSRIEIEAIDQTNGTRLSVGGTEVIARNIMLVETGNNTGVFTASGKVFGSTTVSVNGNITVGSSSTPVYTGGNITLGNTTTGPGVTFKILEVTGSGRLALIEIGTSTTGAGEQALVYVSPSADVSSTWSTGTQSASLSNVAAYGTNNVRFGITDSTRGSSTSGLIKLMEGSDYCLVAISQFIGSATTSTVGLGGEYEVGNGGSVTVSLETFQLTGPRAGDTLKVSYLDELRSTGTSGTATGTLAYGVAGETGTLARDTDAPDINDLVTITVVDANLNTSSSSAESVAEGASLFGGTITNRRGDHLTVSGYTISTKTISLQHPDGFLIGTQTIRISNTSNSLVWMVPTSAGIFGAPTTAGSINIALGTESVSAIPLVKGDSAAADSALTSATTSSFVATLDGLDNTVEISPDGTHWISVPIVETGANSSTFVGTIGFDYTALRLTTNTATSVTALIDDDTGTTTITFANPVAAAGFANGGRVSAAIGTGSVVRIFDGTTQEFTEVCSAGDTTLSVKKLANSTAYDPDKTYVQVVGNDMMPQRVETIDDTVISRIGGYCGATYRIRYNDQVGDSNAYLGGDTLAITTSNMGFTTYTQSSFATDITGTSGPNTFIVVTLVDQDLNTATGSKQSTFEPSSTNSGNAEIILQNENGVGYPSGSSTGNVSRGFVNGATGKILYASTLTNILSSSVDQAGGGNTIDFQLVETANNSGTFKGSFQLSSSIATTNATSTSGGVLKVVNGDTITVFYNDSPSAIACDNSSVYLSTDPITIVTALGNLSLSKNTAYLSGDTIVATVVDEDRDTTAGQDTLTTALKVVGANYDASGTSGDLTMDLVEDGVSSGTFLATFTTGTVTTGGGAGVNSGTIETGQGLTANVIYTDTSPSSSSATRQLTFSAFDATMTFGADSYGLGAYALVTLADAERNTLISTAESLLSDVFIQTSSINSTKVRMVESGVDTGTFVGTIQVVSSGETTEFSKITAVEGDTLTVTYIDTLNTTGSNRSVTDTASVTEAIPTPSPTATVTPTATVVASPTAIPTPSGGVITGSVVDALTTLPIVGATVSTDTGGYSETTDATGFYQIVNVAAGGYLVTASATGYDSSSQPVTVGEGAVVAANFALAPTPPTTPTPIVTPTPTPCVVESITVSPTSLKLKKKKSKTVTVTVGCPDETVTATTTKAGRKVITITPASRTTDASGVAKFKIKAKTKAGNAKVTFKAGGKTKTTTVRVR